MTIIEILNYKLEKLLDNKYSQVSNADKEFILAQAESKIQIYCHRSDIPKEAYYIWADMSIAILNNLEPSLFEDAKESELLDKIKSIQVGDTNLSLSEVDKKGSVTDDNDALLNSFSNQLKAFRKISGGCGVVT